MNIAFKLICEHLILRMSEEKIKKSDSSSLIIPKMNMLRKISLKLTGRKSVFDKHPYYLTMNLSCNDALVTASISFFDEIFPD